MRTYTHITGALVLFFLFAYLTDLNQIVVGVFFAVWASVFPDILDKLIGEHRGWGHSLFWVIPPLLILFFNFTMGTVLIIGFVSHIFFDLITVHGVPVLYPIWKTCFMVFTDKKRIKTGTNQEKALFLVLVFLLIPILFFTLESKELNTHSSNSVFATQNLTTDKFNNINSTNEGIKSNFNINLH